MRVRKDEQMARSTAWKTLAVRWSEGSTPRQWDRKFVSEVVYPEDTSKHSHRCTQLPSRCTATSLCSVPREEVSGPFTYWTLLLTSLQTSLLKLH